MKLEALKSLAEKVEEGPNLLPGGLVAALDEFLPRHTVNNIAPAYNGHLDAAKALHDAVLPGWHATVEIDGEVTISQITIGGDLGAYVVGEEITVQENCPARAWLLAIIRALIAQEESNG